MCIYTYIYIYTVNLVSQGHFIRSASLGFSEDRFSSLRSARPWNRADLSFCKTNFNIPCGLGGLRSARLLESSRP